MAHFKFISHQLIGVLAMSLSEFFVQHNAVADGEASVHAIDKQEYQPGDVACARDKHPDGKQDNERNSDASDIPGKALSLATLTEVEERKHQHRKHHHEQKRRLDEFQFPVHQCERHKYREGIPRRYSINTVHKIVDIRRPNADNQRNDHKYNLRPQALAERKGAGVRKENLPNHQPHRNELHDKPHRIRQRMYVIDKADSSSERNRRKKQRVMKSEKCAPKPDAKQENDSPATQDNTGVRRAHVWFVNDVEMLRQPEVEHF